MRSTPGRPPARRSSVRGTVPVLAWVAALASILLASAVPASSALASLAPPTTGQSSVAPGAGGWRTAFSDSFTGRPGSRLDRNWTYDTGGQYSGAGCTSQWGTGEVESETRSAANVSEGHGQLSITPVDKAGSWTSGRIETASDRFAAPPGGELKVSASIRQPDPASGAGYWPAFWMLGAGFRASGAGTSGMMNCSSWPSVGEIDIMEDVNALSEVSSTLHCGTDPGGPCNETDGIGSGLQPCSGCQTGYNTYTVIVNRTRTSAESITWYLNGTSYFAVQESQVPTATWQSAVDHGFFLILDVGVGGGFPNALCGCSSPTAATSSGAAMSVRYVTVATKSPRGRR